MKFRLEATPGELRDKGDALLEELAKAFDGVNPTLADALEKALPPREPELKHAALRGLKQRTDAEYEAMTKRMLRDVGKILDRAVSGPSFQKSELAKGGTGLPPPEKPEPEEDEGESEEPLEPGDYDPKADEIVPEPEDEDEEDSEKSEVPQTEPLAHDHTKPIADRDERAYQRVKSALQKKGYTEMDFEAGGALYGYSVNQLIGLVRDKAG